MVLKQATVTEPAHVVPRLRRPYSDAYRKRMRQFGRMLLKHYRLMRKTYDSYLAQRQSLQMGGSWAGRELRRLDESATEDISRAQRNAQRLEDLENRHEGLKHYIQSIDDVLDTLDDESKNIVYWHFRRGKPINYLVSNPDECGVHLSERSIYLRIERIAERVALRFGTGWGRTRANERRGSVMGCQAPRCSML